jgi:hypothetical protein
MAELTIRLETDPATGKRNVVISLARDGELLPHEHEQRHRQIVEKLIGQGLLSAQELGQIIVEREEAPAKREKTPEAPRAQREKTAQGE